MIKKFLAILFVVVSLFSATQCTILDDIPIIGGLFEDDDQEQKDKDMQRLFVLVVVLSNNGHNGNPAIYSMKSPDLAGNAAFQAEWASLSVKDQGTVCTMAYAVDANNPTLAKYCF
ncbi:hypothetical protein CH373_14575 [Leptospira perolatii]|uniref:Lipoprotein n=1 Tax=Leptospira perolatii TaxID=2023191 RepID=A0A2M9ZK72_9LEPT|nr:hypothetical protein [Leptospira perolatii]PJZ69244.1 hypothetical protein CH360_12045 [Leptospira perolatii]PJZ72374.1 hypothetical protein CH373_14575 [Leptospira perolatii]